MNLLRPRNLNLASSWALCAFALCFLFGSIAPGQDTVTGAFEGSVTDNQTGEPVAGAQDSLWQATAAPSLVIEEVERIWAAIDVADDWSLAIEAHNTMRRLRRAQRDLQRRGGSHPDAHRPETEPR